MTATIIYLECELHGESDQSVGDVISDAVISVCVTAHLGDTLNG